MNLKLIVPLVLIALFVSACAAGVEAIDAKEDINSTVEPAQVTEEPTKKPTPTLDTDINPPPGATREFDTDFSKHSVPYSEIISGGPSRDVIPSIDDPVFISVDEAESWLAKVEPIIFVQVGDDVRAYPIQILIWHEIVNDTIGGQPYR